MPEGFITHLCICIVVPTSKSKAGVLSSVVIATSISTVVTNGHDYRLYCSCHRCCKCFTMFHVSLNTLPIVLWCLGAFSMGFLYKSQGFSGHVMIAAVITDNSMTIANNATASLITPRKCFYTKLHPNWILKQKTISKMAVWPRITSPMVNHQTPQYHHLGWSLALDQYHWVIGNRIVIDAAICLPRESQNIVKLQN